MPIIKFEQYENYPEVKAIEVVNSFNTDYRKQVDEEVVKPIYDKFEQGRELILSAAREYYATKKEYEKITGEIDRLAQIAKINGETPYTILIRNPIERTVGFDSVNELQLLTDRLYTDVDKIVKGER